MFQGHIQNEKLKAGDISGKVAVYLQDNHNTVIYVSNKLTPAEIEAKKAMYLNEMSKLR